jgi:hypothetical protein
MLIEEINNTISAEQIRYEEKECLDLLNRLSRGKETSGEDKREELLNYCGRHSCPEKQVWRRLSIYAQTGEINPALDLKAPLFFDSQTKKMRERIILLIDKLPEDTQADFRNLLDFTDLFQDRMMFLSDLLLYLFLEREKGSFKSSKNIFKYLDFFHQKLFREFEFIQEIIQPGSVKNFILEYTGWLADKFLDMEALL